MDAAVKPLKAKAKAKAAGKAKVVVKAKTSLPLHVVIDVAGPPRT